MREDLITKTHQLIKVIHPNGRQFLRKKVSVRTYCEDTEQCPDRSFIIK